MAYGLKLGGANLAFKGGLFNGNRYIGLLSAENTELARTRGYARELMTLADWQADGRAQENRAAELFGPPSGGAWLPIVGWDLHDAVTGGNRLFNVDVTDTDAPADGASVGSNAEQLRWSFSGGNLTVAGSSKCANEGLLSGTRWLTLHTGATPTVGDTNTNGSGNAINSDGTSGYGAGKSIQAAGVQEGQWSLDTVGSTRRRARNNAVLSHGITTADLPLTRSVALRDGNAHDSDILWWWPATGNNPDTGDELQWARNVLVIELNFTA